MIAADRTVRLTGGQLSGPLFENTTEDIDPGHGLPPTSTKAPAITLATLLTTPKIIVLPTIPIVTTVIPGAPTTTLPPPFSTYPQYPPTIPIPANSPPTVPPPAAATTTTVTVPIGGGAQPTIPTTTTTAASGGQAPNVGVCNNGYKLLSATADPEAIGTGKFGGYFTYRSSCSTLCDNNYGLMPCIGYMYEPFNRGKCTIFQYALGTVSSGDNTRAAVYEKCIS
uniref:Apple domain-containing protein n=1 Tax=Panagrellus redivivus TaxID=6233 RepID=A0A7E4ZXD1_PANRE